MATKSAKREAERDGLTLIANLLGLLLVRDMPEGDKIGTLYAAGFDQSSIARLLEKDTNAVAVTLFKRRKGKNKGKKN